MGRVAAIRAEADRRELSTSSPTSESIQDTDTRARVRLHNVEKVVASSLCAVYVKNRVDSNSRDGDCHKTVDSRLLLWLEIRRNLYSNIALRSIWESSFDLVIEEPVKLSETVAMRHLPQPLTLVSVLHSASIYWLRVIHRAYIVVAL